MSAVMNTNAATVNIHIAYGTEPALAAQLVADEQAQQASPFYSPCNGEVDIFSEAGDRWAARYRIFERAVLFLEHIQRRAEREGEVLATVRNLRKYIGGANGEQAAQQYLEGRTKPADGWMTARRAKRIEQRVFTNLQVVTGWTRTQIKQELDERYESVLDQRYDR